jgi:hypothetical protein
MSNIKQAIDALDDVASKLESQICRNPYLPETYTTILGNGHKTLKALREYQDGWISVEDKTVPIDEKVMLCFPLANGEYYICSGYIALEDGSVWADSDIGEIGYSAWDISHWQPLPEPPTDKGNG